MTMTDTSDARATAERVPLRTDPRGLVLEPIGAAGLPAQRNVHLVVTEPGAVRDVRVPAGEAWRFLIPPRIGHALANTGSAPQIALGFNTVEHDPAAPDVFPDPLIDPAEL